MNLLLGSGGVRTPERIQALIEAMRISFGDIKEILFIPWALDDFDGYVHAMRQRGLDAGYRMIGIHAKPDPVEAITNAEAVFVGGGNTWRLLMRLQDHGVLQPLRDRVREGLPYLGVSAGTNVACPTIMTTNDMPIVRPRSMDTLGLVPFQINPHYFEGRTHVKVGDGYHEHFGETREDRIREFHEMNVVPVLGLWEGAILRRTRSILELRGGCARLFRRDHPPEDYNPGADLSFLLEG